MSALQQRWGRAWSAWRHFPAPTAAALSPTSLSSNQNRPGAKPPMWLLLTPAVSLSSSELSPTWRGESLGVPKPTHPALQFPPHSSSRTYACWPPPDVPHPRTAVWKGVLDLDGVGRALKTRGLEASNQLKGVKWGSKLSPLAADNHRRQNG